MAHAGDSTTGAVERLDLDANSPWWGEHRSRYRFALRYLGSNSAVLDIACGTGFGTAMLAAGGASIVLGCDASTDAACHASRMFARPSARFLAGDGTRLPFRDGSFDLIASFETIEHIRDYTAFVRELRRVLRPSGTLVLSTPNRRITGSYAPNPFHVKEFVAEELDAVLRSAFSHVEIRGQQLGRRFRVAPFLPGHDVPRSAGDRVRLLAWKLTHRLPHGLKHGLARLFLRRPFYPGEYDFYFEPDVSRAHVMVAVCHP